MSTVLFTAPTIEPITLDEAKLHCRIDPDHTDEDEYLEEAIKAARQHVEAITRRALLTQTWDMYLDEWPCKNYIRLPYGNLQSVPATQSVKWLDTNGTPTTLTLTTDYLWETNGDSHGRIVLPYGGTWPSSTLYPSNPIVIRFVCGWTTAALLPGAIRAAVKIIVTDLYENREAYICTGQPLIPNKAIDNLLASWRLWQQI